jgi:hypothetical protein
MEKKGQTAMEYLLIIAVAIIVIIVVAFFMSTTSTDLGESSAETFDCMMCRMDRDYLWDNCAGCETNCGVSCYVVHAECGASMDSCIEGDPHSLGDDGTNYFWTCNVSGGGNNASCSSPMVIDGTCGDDAKEHVWTGNPTTLNDLCDEGTPDPPSVTLGVSGGSSIPWTCEGIGGGAPGDCIATRGMPPATCGAENNRVYSHGSSGWDTTDFCTHGTSNPLSPLFPGPGGATSWTCTIGTDVASCSASQAMPGPVPGVCNPTAEGDYYSGESFPRGTLCSSGTPDPVTPTQPQIGLPTSWECRGLYGGSTATCTATRVQCISNSHCSGTNQVCSSNVCICASGYADCNSNGHCTCNIGAGNQCRNGECCIRVSGAGSAGTETTFEFATGARTSACSPPYWRRYLVRNDQASINQRCTEVVVGTSDYTRGYLISTVSQWCGAYCNVCYKWRQGNIWREACCPGGGPEVVGSAWCCKA